MSDPRNWLQVKAGGLDLLLSTVDIQEVIPSTEVAPLPGRPRGIQGVIVHHGEFLPVLAWGDLPGCPAFLRRPTALAVLRRRLGLPLEAILGNLSLPPEGWRELEADDPLGSWLSGTCQLEQGPLWWLEPARLVAQLRRFRGER